MTVTVPVTKSVTKRNASLQFSNVRWAAILFFTFMFCAIFIPYIIAVSRRTVNPLLPFISQAAGSPPQSGVFSVFLALSATVGFIGLHMLHLGICIYQKRVPKEKQQLLQFFNKASLLPGHLALLGMVIVGGFPVDFRRNNEDWILVTVAPHLSGAILLFGGGVVYSSILTMTMAIIFPEKKKLICLRVVLLLVTILSAFIHAITVGKAFALEYYDADRLNSCSLKLFEYDSSYLICSICEWVMAVAFISMFLTLEHEGRLFSVTVSVDLLEESGREEQEATGFSKPSPVSDSSEESTERNLDESGEVAPGDQSESTRVKS